MTRRRKVNPTKTNGVTKGEARLGQHGARLLRTIAVIVIAACVAGLASYVSFGLHLGSAGGPKTAVIVDQLSLTQPNPAFVETATSTLELAGYSVDYYPGEEVTVEFYRNLPSHGYNLIVLRVHSGMAREDGEPTGYVSLFTGEPFSERFHDAASFQDAEAGRLGRASYYDGSPQYFGIVPEFIESSMRGGFQDATVIMLGCDGLVTDATAEAFVRKGAEVVVGWNGRVSARHTDEAAEHLLRHLLTDRLSIGEAVARTMADVGPDPALGSTLVVYPAQR
jgi:hypothetical protein